MSWCARKSMCDRLASIAAIMLVAAGSSAAAAEPALDQSAGDTVARPPTATPVARPAARVRTDGSLQHRVDVLSTALQLDARQRALLVSILASQRQAVSKIWSDPALLPAERTPATRAVEERTADQIRAILSEEQRRRYNPAKPQGAAPPLPNVEDWMQKLTQAQTPQQR
jgi:hypothetical protein